ncbi:unnamed protein product [Staurois parvus]|uniref:Uncharacterized protein n=1 Tax=Staurois parvus TaxID=386267 RepID=A0ABN9AXT2_9NEOB|nr:unnamed protein product [Staurois parvus]
MDTDRWRCCGYTDHQCLTVWYIKEAWTSTEENIGG